MTTETRCPVCGNPMDSDLICCENCSVADVLFRRPFYATESSVASPTETRCAECGFPSDDVMHHVHESHLAHRFRPTHSALPAPRAVSPAPGGEAPTLGTLAESLGYTLVHEQTVIRPDAASYVKPSEFVEHVRATSAASLAVREALEWYADPAHWKRPASVLVDDGLEDRWMHFGSPVEADGGDRARAALAGAASPSNPQTREKP